MRKEWKYIKKQIKNILDIPQIFIWEKILLIEMLLDSFCERYDIL